VDNICPNFKRNYTLKSYIICYNYTTQWFRVFLFVCYLRPHLQHMEFPRIGVESELYLMVYTAATAMPYLSCVCDPHHSSWQCWILKHQIEPVSSWIPVGFVTDWATRGTPWFTIFKGYTLFRVIIKYWLHSQHCTECPCSVLYT